MEKPPYYAPLLAVAARLEAFGPLNSQLCALYCTSFFKAYKPVNTSLALAKLAQAQLAADFLAQATGTGSAALLVQQVACSVFAGADALLAGLGIEQVALSRSVVLRELGRLVVKQALPSSLSYYAAGGVGSFSMHRLPLAQYPAFLHIDNSNIASEATLSAALKQARYRKANYWRTLAQRDASLAIRDQDTGEVVQHFGPQHWQQLTWRLGYTTVFDLVSDAWVSVAKDDSAEPAPAELLHAAQVISGYCTAFFGAFLAGAKVVEHEPSTALAA